MKNIGKPKLKRADWLHCAFTVLMYYLIYVFMYAHIKFSFPFRWNDVIFNLIDSVFCPLFHESKEVRAYNRMSNV